MNKNDYGRLLKQAEREYLNLKYLPCPKLDGQKIYFTRSGFRHFLRSSKKIRPISDQMRRFRLIRYIKDIITSPDSVLTIPQQTVKNPRMIFRRIQKEISGGVVIRLVIGQIGAGKIHFVSIMDG